jgi:hypothetical protein
VNAVDIRAARGAASSPIRVLPDLVQRDLHQQTPQSARVVDLIMPVGGSTEEAVKCRLYGVLRLLFALERLAKLPLCSST